ncbi:response regulator [Tuwongella immobilis]|uniref:Response regulatory domain-containing protein n=1 Tax=Tuwongella immobilis TaxID=692036 RepID=A0A6C2YH73_9BACT|nr:response regulator [Tuwongella immobilis]VIP00591.1 response regulator receiver protein : Response regulator with CheY-like receiver, AAA-type ATPase, and DNA-binding domains OS=Singulisphaera acidiphila (strain ATCC BAA-1392 / DSM 18658 / VKM B-2454 / MOB10) GN=Sinac_6217 PE=4 SV=1: Response_reg [Tuwongella immobilis]VTR96600.1 response regulator receiver protein : Response regulator with CheY-like receiver, AAA-type ATPase, and DNA-binding domains OS=Singulisphaera acidiphila (strain ATCC BA
MNETGSTDNYVILITDDDRSSRESLRDMIEPEGFRTFLAASGEEAIEIVQQESIHLAIFDYHMPTLTGLETLQLIHQSNIALPCILVTADATKDLMRQALNAQAYSVIPKPVSKNVVLYTVIRALGRFYGRLRTPRSTWE